MRILGIDTSSKFLSIALSEDTHVITEESHLVDRAHSALLVPKIKEMLERLGLGIDDVDTFVVGLGPGSFTGLRIGISSIKGFGIATEKPCIGIPSIDALAMNADSSYKTKTIVPIIDAKRGQVYCAIYRKDNNHIVRKSGYLLLDVDTLMGKIREAAIFLGDGIGLYRERIESYSKEDIFLKEECWYPKADNLIRLAFKKIKSSKKINLAGLKPIYIYPKDCQVLIK